VKKKNRFLAWLHRPHGFLLVLVYLLTLAAVVGSIVLVTVGENSVSNIFSYVLFGLSAVLLGYTVYTIVIYAPHMRSKWRELLKRNRVTAKLLGNYGFRTAVFALFSFAVTLAFTIMNTVGAVRYGSVWYGAIAGYYAILMLLRGGTIAVGTVCAKKSEADNRERTEWKIYRAGGACLLVLEIAMVAAVTQLMLSGRPTERGQIMAIANAAYTFFKLSMAIYNLVKAHKFRAPLTQALRNYSFADACMSVASLTVLMISTFAEGTEGVSEMVNVKAIIGFAACASIIVLAIIMLVRAQKKIKAIDLKSAESFVCEKPVGEEGE